MKKVFYEFSAHDAVMLAWVGVAAVFISAVCFFSTAEASTDVEEQNDTYIAEEYVEYCEEIGSHLGICPELLEAMIEVESSGRPDAQNGNCVGLMQVNATVWSDLAYDMQIGDATDPYENILLGATVLLQYIDQCDGEVAWALMKYNGFSKADYYIENGWMTKYAERILDRAAELERAHGK